MKLEVMEKKPLGKKEKSEEVLTEYMNIIQFFNEADYVLYHTYCR